MEKVRKIIYHKDLINFIEPFNKTQNGFITKPTNIYDNLEATLNPEKNRYSLSFNIGYLNFDDKIFSFEKDHKNVEFKIEKQTLIFESISFTKFASDETKANVRTFRSKGFSKKTEYYFRLMIPLKKEFHFDGIQQTGFDTDLGFFSRLSTKINLVDETIEICCVNKKKGNFYLSIESTKKQTYKEFSDKVFATQIGIGFISGYYPGDKGYFFAYRNKEKKKYSQVYFTELRGSIMSSYGPVASNVSYLMSNKYSKKFNSILRSLNTEELAKLIEKIHSSNEFSSALLLIQEASVASLLIMPGTYAIALESLSTMINETYSKPNAKPIKDNKLAKKIREELSEIINNYSTNIGNDGVKVLLRKIEGINQITNKSRLHTPFDNLGLSLNQNDLEILEIRNDLLHGRYPDILKAGKNRPLDLVNRELLYTSMKLYTLLSMLILKWIGYDSYVVNYPKINEKYTKIRLREEPYRKI